LVRLVETARVVTILRRADNRYLVLGALALFLVAVLSRRSTTVRNRRTAGSR
jgi:hypothetical protein